MAPVTPPRKLGRIAPSKARLAALPAFAALLAPQLPPPPPALDFTSSGKAYAGPMGNDVAGNCTLAGVGHLQQGWSAANGGDLVVTAEEAIAAYRSLEGYDPRTGQPDNGLVETDVLDYWQATGLYGNRLEAYTVVNPTSVEHVKQAIWVYGGIYLGMMFPSSAMAQTDAGVPWTPDWFSRIEGGHCVVSQKYDEEYIYLDTWGILQPATWDFFARYFDAAYAVYNKLWLDGQGKSPGGLDAAGLSADLVYVAN